MERRVNTAVLLDPRLERGKHNDVFVRKNNELVGS